MRFSNMIRGMFDVDPLTKEGDDEYYKAARTFSNYARGYLGFDPLEQRYSVMDQEGLEQNKREKDAYKSSDFVGVLHDILPPKAALTGVGLGLTAGWRALRGPDYQKALKMLDEGKGYREILKETSVHAKPNQPLFHEISDDKSRLKLSDAEFEAVKRGERGSKSSGTLGELFEHDELYENYPELKDWKLEFKPLGKESGGYLDIPKKTVVINRQTMDNPLLARSGILHELDHAIAVLEKFPAGGDPINMIVGKEAGQLAGAARYAKERALEKYNNLDTYFWNMSPNSLEAKRKQLEKEIRRFTADEKYWRNLSKYDQELNPNVDVKYQAYLDLWGEKTARTTQNRMLMSKQKRLENPGAYEHLQTRNPEAWDRPESKLNRPAIFKDYYDTPMDFELEFNIDEVLPPTIK